MLEHHPELRVRKNIFRDQNNAQVNHTPYDWIVHCEQNGLFLPSYALTCNIVAALYRNRNNPDANALLQQYKNHGTGYGWHAQNTVIDWGTGHIIHYPYDAHFPSSGGTSRINQSQPHKRIAFDKTGFASITLENALQRPNFKNYIRNLTGLANPADLVEIGNYFGKPAMVWVSSSNDTRAAWFGCNSYNFNLNTDLNLNSYDAARGVRRSAP